MVELYTPNPRGSQQFRNNFSPSWLGSLISEKDPINACRLDGRKKGRWISWQRWIYTRNSAAWNLEFSNWSRCFIPNSDKKQNTHHCFLGRCPFSGFASALWLMLAQCPRPWDRELQQMLLDGIDAGLSLWFAVGSACIFLKQNRDFLRFKNVYIYIHMICQCHMLFRGVSFFVCSAAAWFLLIASYHMLEVLRFDVVFRHVVAGQLQEKKHVQKLK